jgi:hypothetical protein
MNIRQLLAAAALAVAALFGLWRASGDDPDPVRATGGPTAARDATAAAPPAALVEAEGADPADDGNDALASAEAERLRLGDALAAAEAEAARLGAELAELEGVAADPAAARRGARR